MDSIKRKRYIKTEEVDDTLDLVGNHFMEDIYGTLFFNIIYMM